jgi:general secretion pathway protein G
VKNTPLAGCFALYGCGTIYVLQIKPILMKFLNSNSYKKGQGGFTLMELLVVVAIMAILLAVIMVSVSSSRQKGRDARRINDMRSISNALELYFAQNRTYPAGIPTGSATLGLTALVPNYISAIPQDPSGTDYWYTGLNGTPPSCNGYHLGVSLETNNTVLASDADFVSTTGTLRCPGGAGSLGISGPENTGAPTSGRCRSGATGDPAGTLCYDVINKQ